MSIGPPILEIQHFQHLTLKIKGQGHGWGHSSKSQCWSSILSTNIPFVPCQSALPFLRYSIFKIWPWKSRVKVMGEVTVEIHNVGLTSYWLIPFVPCQSALPFLIQHFQNFTLKNQGSRSNDPAVGQSLDPICGKFDKFLAHGQAYMGQKGQMTMTVHN